MLLWGKRGREKKREREVGRERENVKVYWLPSQSQDPNKKKVKKNKKVNKVKLVSIRNTYEQGLFCCSTLLSKKLSLICWHDQFQIYESIKEKQNWFGFRLPL